MWLAMHALGVEPALAGVVVGLITPAVAFQRPRHVSEEAYPGGRRDGRRARSAGCRRSLVAQARLALEGGRLSARARRAPAPAVDHVRGAAAVRARERRRPRSRRRACPTRCRARSTLGVAIGHVVGKVLGDRRGYLAGGELRVWAGYPRGRGSGTSFAIAAAAGVAFTVSFFVGDVAFGGRPDLHRTGEGRDPGFGRRSLDRSDTCCSGSRPSAADGSG